LISGAVGPGEHESETSSIWLVSILGSAPRRLRGEAHRAMLSPNDSLVAYMSKNGIWLADADGENPREFIGAKVSEFVGSPQWSPDGKRVVYRRSAEAVTTIESRGLDDEISTVLVRKNLKVGEQRRLFAKDFLMLDDRLVYAMNEPSPRNRDWNLWEITIDLRSGKPKGEPRRLTDLVGFNIASLSVTADGSQLAFENRRGQTDVYVGELDDGGRSLHNARRLTLDDRRDRPSCWTPDGRAVVFQSDRYGTKDILVQGLDEQDAQDLVRGAGDQSDPHLTPDGKSFLYWESGDDASGSKQLLRIPVGGGPTELVLEAQRWGMFDCATTPDGPCLLLEVRFEEGIATLSGLDPVAGKGEEFLRIEITAGTNNRRAALSPDGSQFAVIGHTENDRSIRLENALTGDVMRDIEVDGVPGMGFKDLEWSPDGSGFYIVAASPRGEALLRVDLQGEAHVLYEEQTGDLYAVRPSPDGRHLAFGKMTHEANVWMIEKF
jgi:Tol biopolymer transport system component